MKPRILSVAAELPRRPGQHGFALITTLMILVMLTLLGVSMYRSFGLQEKVAGNTREKERAFQLAQNTLTYGEWLLLNGSPGTGVTCSGSTTVSSTTNMRVCTAALTTPADPSTWTTAQTYTPPSVVVASGGGLAAATTANSGNSVADINYAATPKLYMNYLGLSADGKQSLYQVTASASGGSSSTQAVVKSVYAISTSTTNLDQP
jgi:type IV pilus assembly protein PilX